MGYEGFKYGEDLRAKLAALEEQVKELEGEVAEQHQVYASWERTDYDNCDRIHQLEEGLRGLRTAATRVITVQCGYEGNPQICRICMETASSIFHLCLKLQDIEARSLLPEEG